MKEKVKTIRELTIKRIYPMLDKYIDWACDCGLYLPPDYALDPTSWAEALRKMQRAFRILSMEYEGEGELWKAKVDKNEEKIARLEADIQEGLTLYGKYLFFLTDVIVDRGPAHDPRALDY